MDKNQANAELRVYKSIGHLIKEAYGFSAKQMEKKMEWAEQEAKSANPLGGKTIPEPPDNEFQIILAKMEARGIIPRLMADFDQESQKAMEEESFWDAEVLPHEKDSEIKGSIWAEVWESAKTVCHKPMKIAGVAAACLLLVVMLFTLPMVDVMAKKHFEYQPRMKGGESSKIVWNDQADIITDEGSLEEAYAKIKKELNTAVLKMNYLPSGMLLTELEIQKGYARMEFTYEGNSIYMLTASYLKDNSTAYYSDRQIYTSVKNEWIEKEIPVHRNLLSKGKYEYQAYVGIGNTYYTFEGIMEEKEFLDVLENLTLEK